MSFFRTEAGFAATEAQGPVGRLGGAAQQEAEAHQDQRHQ